MRTKEECVEDVSYKQTCPWLHVSLHKIRVVARDSLHSKRRGELFDLVQNFFVDHLTVGVTLGPLITMARRRGLHAFLS